MKRSLRGLSTLFLAVAICGGVQAHSYPSKPIRLVVPYPPGGSNDTLSRIIAETMIPGIGLQIVIDNLARGAGIQPD